MKKNLYPLTLAILFTTRTFAQAAPTITYDWTLTGSSFGNGSGTFTLDAASDVGADSSATFYNGNGYDYEVLSITGTFAGMTVTKDTNTFSTLNFSTATLPGGSLLNEEVYFMAGSTEYDIQNPLGNDVPNPAKVEENYGSNGFDAGTDTLTVTPVPEPGSLALAGVGGLALLGWRTRRHTATPL